MQRPCLTALRLSNTVFCVLMVPSFMLQRCAKTRYLWNLWNINMHNAWDDVKWLSLRNEVSNVGKDTGITVKLRVGRVRHLSSQISYPQFRTGKGSPTQASLYPLYFDTISTRQPIHLATTYWSFVPYLPDVLWLGGPWPPGYATEYRLLKLQVKHVQVTGMITTSVTLKWNHTFLLER